MKRNVLALILALTVVSWAQTATQSAPSTPQQSTTEKAKCACCDKMAESKDGHTACMRHAKNGDAKQMASCCAGNNGGSCCGKDAKSCMKDDNSASCSKDGCCKQKDKTASCCTGKSCCKGCCGSNKTEKPA